MTQPRNIMVDFQKVNLKFPHGCHLFHDLSLTIHEKSFTFLTGMSGVGKSTLLKMIYLAQIPTTGLARVFGADVTQVTPTQAAICRRKIGVVFQDFRLIPHLTALENVALPLKINQIHNRQREREAIELLEWVGLKDHLHVPPSLLSGGQQQRVAIARAIVGRPRILLADEPTGNVDDQVAMRLLYLFEELYKTGTTVIIATHNHTLAESFPYPEIMLKDGKIRHKEAAPAAKQII